MILHLVRYSNEPANKKSTVLLTIISKLRRKESIDVFGLNTSYKNINEEKSIIYFDYSSYFFVGFV